MKSAIEWLMGKSESMSIKDAHAEPANNGAEQDAFPNDRDSSEENSLLNGHFSGASPSRGALLSSPYERSRKANGEESLSPWGRTLTPKSPKYVSQLSQKAPHTPSRLNSSLGSARMSPSNSWEEMSFASDVLSPGFAARIAKESKNGRNVYDGARRYPVGQEKYIRTGILPNVRLKGRSKPVVLTRRAPTTPLLPLASASSPFSSSSLASGFLSSASTRMPDISSVVSVLDSTPSTSGYETIRDPTSVQAVVAALEQAQNLKSGIKRSRYGEPDDSNKKQKCAINSSAAINDFSTPLMTQAFNTGIGSAGLGGEKRALDLSPPSGGESSPSGRPQLSPENKRRCVADPRIASFSSSKYIKNMASQSHSLQSSGRETPFSIYESQQDSDSESNKSMESHHSRQSERSFRVQNHDSSCGGRGSNQDNFDRSESHTPQSTRGSYGFSGGISNGSNSSSRTTTPSRPSHGFSLEAYKTDKAKSHQRLNKMLGMLFNVSDDEILPPVQQPVVTSILSPAVSTCTTAFTTNIIPSSLLEPAAVATTTSAAASTFAPATAISTPSAPTFASAVAASAPSQESLKEAFTKVQSDLPPEQSKEKERQTSSEGVGKTEVSSSYTFTLKPSHSVLSTIKETPTEPKSNSFIPQKINISASFDDASDDPRLPSYKDSVAASTSGNISALSASLTTAPTFLLHSTHKELPNPNNEKQAETKELPPPYSITSSAATPTSSKFLFPSMPVSSSLSATTSTDNGATTFSANPLEALKNTTFSIDKTPVFSFGSSPTKKTSTASPPPPSSSAIPTFGMSIFPPAISVTSAPVSESSKTAGLFSFGSNATATSSISFGSLSAPSTVQSNPNSTFTNTVKPSETVSQPSITSSSVSNENPSNVMSSGLFSFGAPAIRSDPVSNKITSSAESSQAAPPPLFTFGSSVPSNSSGVSTALNLFTFGSSNLQTVPNTTQTGGISTPSLSSISGMQTSKPTVSFSFNSSQSNHDKTSSADVTTSSSMFGGSIFSFGSNPSNPPPVSAPIQNPQMKVEASGLFAFGDSTKTTKPASATPFQFGTTPTSSASMQTPMFGSDTGGGFSFGGMKTNTTATPQFGSTTTTATPQFGSTSSSFTFSAPKPSSGFEFSTPKTSAATGPSNMFSVTFNNNNTQPSIFGAPSSSTGNGFGSASAAVKPLTFSFGNEKKQVPQFGAQSPPAFGTKDASSNGSKSMFGSQDSSKPFGSGGATSPFSGGQSQSPFNAAKLPAASPAFGTFGAASNPTENPSLGAGAAPNPNPFQMGQSANQNSGLFSFGQPAQNPTPGIFTFGSQGSAPSNPTPTPGFGSGTFSFGSNTGMSGVDSVASNPFNVGAATDTPSAPRRPKARAHRRR